MLHWAAQAGKAEVVRLVIEEFQLECNARDKASVDLETSLVLQYGGQFGVHNASCIPRSCTHCD